MRRRHSHVASSYSRQGWTRGRRQSRAGGSGLQYGSTFRKYRGRRRTASERNRVSGCTVYWIEVRGRGRDAYLHGGWTQRGVRTSPPVFRGNGKDVLLLRQARYGTTGKADPKPDPGKFAAGVQRGTGDEHQGRCGPRIDVGDSEQQRCAIGTDFS